MSRAFDCLVLCVALFVAFAWARPAAATIVVAMAEADLTAQSAAVVIGRVTDVASHWDPAQGRIFTTITVAVQEVLKGEVTAPEITLTQLGGTVRDVHGWVHGNPEFRRGEKVLVFVSEAPDGTLRVTQLYQGKFSLVVDPYVLDELAQRDPNPQGVHVLPPAPGGAPAVHTWKLDELKGRIRAWAGHAGRQKKLRSSQPVSSAVITEAAESFTFIGQPSRWFEPDSGLPVTIFTNQSGEPATPGGGFTEVRAALNAWTSASGSSLDFRDGGLTSAGGLVNDGVSAVSFRDPLNQIGAPSGCSGTLAMGGYYGRTETRTINGTVFNRIVEADVVTADGWQGCGFYENRLNFAEVLTHELGHGLGFGHNSDPASTMAPIAHFDGRGAWLHAADIVGLVFAYPGASGGGTTPTSYTLTVTRAGATGGVLTSTPIGVTCGTDCSHTYAQGTTVALTASAPAGVAFTGWGGACAGVSAMTCMVTMNANTSVTGSFVTLGPAPRPNLRLSAVSEPPGSAVRGARFAVTDTVVNAGNASAGSSRTRYYLSVAGTRAAGDILLGSTRLVQTLATGAQSQGTVTVVVPSNTPFGTYRLLACADDTFVIAETDEADNCAASVGSIVIGQPDLVISALTSPLPSARRGTAVTLTDTVTNNGTAPAAASTTRYYVSLDAVRNTGDRLMTGTRSVGTLAPGATSTGTVNAVIPSTLTPGTYYVIACADDFLRVTESGANNNCRAAPTRISVTP